MHHRERSVSGPQHPLGILACLFGTIAEVLGKATTGMVSEHSVQDFGGLGMASSPVTSNFAREQCCRPCKLTAFRFKVSSCANYKFEHLTTDFPDLGISSSDILVCHDLVCQSLTVSRVSTNCSWTFFGDFLTGHTPCASIFSFCFVALSNL